MTYGGPIRPGMRFVWAPNLDHARQRVEVTRVETNADGETWIFTRELDGSLPRGEHANDEDNFRDMCVPIEELYFERWLVLPVIREHDEVPGVAPGGPVTVSVVVRLLADVAERNGADRERAEEIGRRVFGGYVNARPSASSMREMCQSAAQEAVGRDR